MCHYCTGSFHDLGKSARRRISYCLGASVARRGSQVVCITLRPRMFTYHRQANAHRLQPRSGGCDMASTFRDLRVWQEAMELTVQVYKSTGTFPKSETYGLAQQMQRAAVSVPSNIAEG